MLDSLFSHRVWLLESLTDSSYGALLAACTSSRAILYFYEMHILLGAFRGFTRCRCACQWWFISACNLVTRFLKAKAGSKADRQSWEALSISENSNPIKQYPLFKADLWSDRSISSRVQYIFYRHLVLCRSVSLISRKKSLACWAQSPKNIGASDLPPRPPSNRSIKVTADGDDDRNRGPHLSSRTLLGGCIAVSMLMPFSHVY